MQRSFRRNGVKILLIVIGTLAIYCLSLALRICWAGKQDARMPADVIIVLGAAQYDGRPSPVLRARIDHAMTLYRTGYAPRMLFTGGSRPGDRFTEAETARNYAIHAGIPPEAILTECQGHTTVESLRAAAGIMRDHRLESAILVSDPFHAFRLQHIANDLGLHAVVSPDDHSPVRSRGAKLQYITREVFVYLAYRLMHV